MMILASMTSSGIVVEEASYHQSTVVQQCRERPINVESTSTWDWSSPVYTVMILYRKQRG